MAQKENSVKEEKKLMMDVDVVIRRYNKANPDKKQLDRQSLAEQLGNNPQLFSDWKRGKVPKAIKMALELCEIGQCTLSDFITEKKY